MAIYDATNPGFYGHWTSPPVWGVQPSTTYSPPPPPLPPAPVLGWTCPKCGRCFSPFVAECRKCRPRDDG